MRVWAYLLILTLSACGAELEYQDKPVHAFANIQMRGTGPVSYKRIVSLDYCADQYVLKLVPSAYILALSPDATSSFSYMREAAADHAQIRPRAENVLALQPDLIVRSYGGGPKAKAFFESAGVPIVQLGYARQLDDIPALTKQIAHELGQEANGADLIADIQARLAKLEGPSGQAAPASLYMTPGGMTSGPGSLIDDMMKRAGFANFETRPGWHTLPLERLTHTQPDHITASFFAAEGLAGNSWSSARHPVARAQLQNRPVTSLNGAWTACGAWFLLDAVDALTQTGKP